MNTDHSSPNGQNKNNKTANQTGQSGPAKKKKSAGFIETSGFKPTWLETGPLTPEILHDSLNVQDKIEPAPDEAIQAEAEPVIEEPSSTEHTDQQPTQADEVTSEPQTVAVEEQPPPQAADEQPEEWLQTLLENGNSVRSAEPEATTAMEEILWAEPAAAEYESFIVETPEDIAEEEIEEEQLELIPTMEATASEANRPLSPMVKKRSDRWTPGLLLMSLIFLGLAAVIFFINPQLTGFSYLLIGLAGLLLLLMAARLLILHNDRLRMEHGCPQCSQPELMRVSRRSGQRLLNTLGIPAYRYRCRNCTWEGTRLSDVGEAYSSGSLFAHAKDM